MILNSDHLTEIEVQKFKNDWEVLMSKEKNMEEEVNIKIKNNSLHLAISTLAITPAEASPEKMLALAKEIYNWVKEK